MWNRATCHHPYNPPTAAWLPRSSCHQALWPSATAAPGLQPALCLHRQRSSIAACPLPAHSRLLLGHSSLPFASLQTLKTPRTPKTPTTLHRRCGTCFVIALCYWGIQACRYQASNVSKSYNPPNPSRHLPPPLQSSNCCMASSTSIYCHHPYNPQLELPPVCFV